MAPEGEVYKEIKRLQKQKRLNNDSGTLELSKSVTKEEEEEEGYVFPDDTLDINECSDGIKE